MDEKKLKEMAELLKEDSRQSLTKLSRKIDLPIIETFNHLKEIRKNYSFTIIKKD